VGGGILLSRLAGLARERVIARYLGVGLAVDAFRAAVRIPNLLQNLLGEGVLSASFIPVYARLLDEAEENEQSHEEAGRVAGAIAGLLAALAGTLALIGVVLARPITTLLTPGFEGERLDLTVTLTRIMFPGVGFLVLSAWCLGILNSHRRFFLSYVAPVLWNGAQIAVLVALGMRGWASEDLAVALAWGAFAGGALQLLVQLPAVRQLAGPVRVTLRTDLGGVRDTVRRFLPVVAGRGVVQLSAYVDLLLASLLVVGAVSAIGYAQVFYLLPISLFGMSVAAAELPEMARAESQEPDLMRDRIEEGLARIAFFVVPCVAVYTVAGDLVVGALLQTGEFGPEETRLVWYVLVAFSIGLVATTGSRLIQNALYAVGDTRSPAQIATIRVVVAVVLGIVLMFQLDRIAIVGPGFDVIGDLPAPMRPLPEATRSSDDGPLRLGAVGIAAAAGLAAWLELALLRRRLAPVTGSVRLGGGHLGRTVVAAGAAAAVAAGLRQLVLDLHPIAGAVIALTPAGLVYVALTRLLRVPEADALVRPLGRFVRRG
jgi:putative peptidoglycan lipid II flippase